VFVLNTCSSIVGSQVLSFKNEAEMLQAWRDFVAEVDPDMIIGYNIANFDFPYVLDRGKAFKVGSFTLLGTLTGSCWAVHLHRHITHDPTRYEMSHKRHSFFFKSLRTA
jgi:DNA polymerase elongation subunit (family B)